MFRYNKIRDFNLENKIVGVRVDINSPIINEEVKINKRIIEHSKTIKDLVTKKAKVVILAHQGRIGKSDCISLKRHAELIEKQIGKKVYFINEIYSNQVEKKIKSLKSGEVLLIENLRFIEDELDYEKKNNKILKLEKLFDYYVIDAFSVAHRKQTSMIGFKKIPLIAGNVMDKELRGLNKINNLKKPVTYVLGGAKPDDLIDILEVNFEKEIIDYAILSGVIGEICLMIKGYDIGCKKDFLKEKGYLSQIKRIEKLYNKYKNNIILPKDVALIKDSKRCEIKVDNLKDNKELVDNYKIEDIGKLSIKQFNHIINISESIYFKGPPGNFEVKELEYGSKNLINNISKSKAFKFLGGGHSVTAVESYAKISDFSYVSLAGGALVKFLSGQKLPGVEVLEESFNKTVKDYEDFIIVGSNTLDIDVQAPITLGDFHLGEKFKVEEDFKQTIGGGGINVSVCLSRLGGKVAYLGKISNENYDKIKNVLRRNKVDLIKSKITKKPCAKSILIDTKDNDRVIFTYRGQNSELDMKDFNFGDIKADNFYFSSLAGKSFKTMINFAKKVKQDNENSMICLNLSYTLINNEKNLNLLIKNCDILVLNLQEAELFSKKNTVSDCLKYISKFCKVVVITDGSCGAYAFNGINEYFVESVKSKKVVDTTGAGDCFAGTFFYFYILGNDIDKCLKFAAKNSSNVVSYKGALDGLMYFDDLNK